MNGEEIVWDLTEIFTSCNDPRISKTFNSINASTRDIISQFKGKINTPSFTAKNLQKLLIKYEELLTVMYDLELYSTNSFRANSSLPETKALYNKFISFKSSILEKLTFLEFEVENLVFENPQIMSKNELKNYTYYLEKVRRKIPFRLTEVEERLILEKDQHGVIALEQLRASWISTRKFKANVEGKEKVILRSEVFPLCQHPDRETRKSVFNNMYRMFEQDQEIYSSVVKNVCSNWVKNVIHRQYDSQIQQSFIDSEITNLIVENMIKAISESINIFQKFWRIKAKILNLPKIEEFDIPAFLSLDKRYTWNEIKSISFQIFYQFDKSFGDIVNDMFERKHIDASIRDGKSDFVYCPPWYRGKSAFILTGFTGLLSDISSLCHEFGHAIHWYLASREQTLLNFVPAMILAEISPFFSQLLLADYLLSNAESKKERVAMLTNLLTGTGSNIFWMTARMWCEKYLYDAIERGENLDGNTISNYWCTARDKIYGDCVDWSDKSRWEWVNFSYYCYPYNRFLNYQYACGQLIAYALFNIYKEEGIKFVPKFKLFLSAGCSKSPEDLMRIFGLNITEPDFWNLGLKQYEKFINRLNTLIS